MKEIKAPGLVNDAHRCIFLAGSIEMGSAERWQDQVAGMLRDSCWTILNPRRDDWDSSWKQDIQDPNFREQVNWELHGIERSDYVIMYFDPATKSPITLLELGLLASMCPQKVIVVCPDGYWKKGNVDVVCDRYGIRICTTLEKACRMFK